MAQSPLPARLPPSSAPLAPQPPGSPPRVLQVPGCSPHSSAPHTPPEPWVSSPRPPQGPVSPLYTSGPHLSLTPASSALRARAPSLPAPGPRGLTCRSATPRPASRSGPAPPTSRPRLRGCCAGAVSPGRAGPDPCCPLAVASRLFHFRWRRELRSPPRVEARPS